MSIQFTPRSFGLGNVLPFGWEPYPGKWGGKIIGHEFTMVGTFKLKSKWIFGKSKHIASSLPALQWREREYWWEGASNGGWTYKGCNDKGDLYRSSPSSLTWGGFKQSRISDVRNENWIEIPGSDVRPASLHRKLLSLKQQQLVAIANSDVKSVKTSPAYKALQRQSQQIKGKYNESKIEMWWAIASKLATNNRELPCAALDRPGIALSGGSGQSGGNFRSRTTASTRRRVLQFDLSMTGFSTHFTATQILETKDGKPSISKFIIPGKPDEWVLSIPDPYLAYWRSRLNQANVEDQTFELESQSKVNQWTQWVARLQNKGLV